MSKFFSSFKLHSCISSLVFAVLLTNIGFTQNPVICTGNPQFINIVMLVDKVLVDAYGGNFAAAQQAARANLQSGINAMNSNFGNNLNIRAAIKFTPNWAVEVNGTFGNSSWNNNVKLQFLQRYPCVPADVLVIFTNQGSGLDQSYAGVVALSQTNNSELVILHEIFHTWFSHTAPSSNCCNEGNKTLMCSEPKLLNLDFTCDGVVPTMNALCLNHSDIMDELSNDFACPQAPSVSADYDGTIFTNDCTPPRNTAIFKVTVRANNDKIYYKLRPIYNDQFFDFVSNSGTQEFNFIGSSSIINFKTLRILTNLNDPESDQVFELEPNSSRTFEYRLNYNPDSGVELLASNYGSLTTRAQVFYNFSNANLTKVASAQRQVRGFVKRFGNIGFFDVIPTLVTGDIEINGASSIPCPEILVTEGKHIRVSNNALLSASTPVTISGCTKMWEGFLLENGSVKLANTIIKDAQYGISMTGNSNSDLRNVTFDNNDVGIRSFNISGANAGVFLSGVHFENSLNSLKESYSGQTPLPVGGSYAGIVAVNSPGIVIGAGNTPPNIFSGLKNGIVSNFSDIIVENTVIKHMKNEAPGANYPVGFPDASIRGTGIYQRNGTLQIKGFGSSADNFTDCIIGIKGINALMSVEECKMSDVKQGIVSLSNLQSAKLTNNNIDAEQMGINVHHRLSPPSGWGLPPVGIGTQVSGNVVTVQQAGSGIQIGAGEQGEFSYNTIDMKSSGAAMSTFRSNKARIKRNTITLAAGPTSATAQSYGIRSESGDQISMLCNNVAQAGTPAAGGGAGVYALHVTRALVSCNTATGTAFGLNLAGESVSKGAATVCGNNTSGNAGGLLLGTWPDNGDAVIGVQNHRGNLWNGGYGLFGARHLGGQAGAFQSRFFVDQNDGPNLMPPPVIEPNFWFIDQAGTTFACPAPAPGNECSETPFTGGGGGGSESDVRTARGQWAGDNFGDALNWLAQRRLYERLSEEGNPYLNNSAIDSFLYLSNQNGIAAYAGIETGLRSATALSAANETALLGYEQEIMLHLDSLYSLHTRLCQFGLSTADSTSLRALRDAEALALYNASAARKQLIGSIQLAQAGPVITLLYNNNSLTVSNLYTANEKTVNHVLLQTVALGIFELSSAQRSILQPIAAQCPLEGGEAVVKARMLLTLDGLPLNYNDELTCNLNLRSHPSRLSMQPSTGYLKVYPNPASDQIVLDYSHLPIDRKSVFTLFDHLGRTVNIVELSASTDRQIVMTGTLPNGVYYYSVPGLGGGKLIVHHN